MAPRESVSLPMLTLGRLEHAATLRDLLRARGNYERFRDAKPRELSAEERQSIREAVAEIARLWRDGSLSTAADRTDIRRLLIVEVIATVDGETELIDVSIRWEGGSRTDLRLHRPVRSWTQMTVFETLHAKRSRRCWEARWMMVDWGVSAHDR